jgi:hypothetical protein
MARTKAASPATFDGNSQNAKYLTSLQAAAFLGVGENYLRKLRYYGQPPAALKTALNGRIFYAREEIEKFALRRSDPAVAYDLEHLKPIDLAAKRRAYERRRNKRQFAKFVPTVQP